MKNQKAVKGIVDKYKNHLSITDIKEKNAEFAETNKNDLTN